jgi:hypothetical protein
MSNPLIDFKMKKLLVIAAILLPLPALAGPPFKYQTNCFLESSEKLYDDVCTVVETRENTGALRTRNIYSNRWGLTIKSRFDKVKGFVTWDSHNNYEYKWEYKVGGSGFTYVMPGVMLENVSWD